MESEATRLFNSLNPGTKETHLISKVVDCDKLLYTNEGPL
jgi:hypothetical protein